MENKIPRKNKKRKKPVEIPAQLSLDQHNPISDFKEMYLEYFRLTVHEGSKNKRVMFEKRVNDELLLEEIGKIYGLCRERVRQVVERTRIDFYKLVSGESINTPCVYLNEMYVSRMMTFKQNLHTKYIHTKKDILKYLEVTYPTSSLPTEDVEGYLNLLMFTFNFGKFVIEGTEVYTNLDKFNSFRSINEYTTAIKAVLRDSILPINIWDIAKKSKVDYYVLVSLLPILDIAEKVGEDTYQLNPKHFSNIMDVIYRVLKEKGSSMTFSEIKQHLDSLGLELYSNFVANRFSLDPRFCSVGKKSTYALTEWGTDTRSYKNIIEDALRELGRPATLTELYNITNKTSDIATGTITSYIHAYPKTFKRVKDNKIALFEWEEYEECMVRRPKTMLSQDTFEEYLLNFIINSGKDYAQFPDIYEDFCSKFSRLREASIIFKMTKCRFVTTLGRGKDCVVVLKPDYQSIVEKSKTAKQEKLNRFTAHLTEEASNILRVEGPMLMSDLVSKLMLSGASRPTVYRALEIGPFEKDKVSDGLKNTRIISLRGTNNA